jgi:alpha-glucoside transport system substrate-binding protein
MYGSLKRFVVFISALAVLALPVAHVSASTTHAAAVTFLGGWGAGEQTDFKAILSYCDAHYGTNATYQYAPGGNVDTYLATLVSGGHPPDAAALSDPSEIAQYANGNSLVAINWLNKSKFNKQYSSFWRTLGTVSGKLYAIYMKADVKSLVWYSPKKFKAGGYKIPKTYAQMIALSKQMVSKGKTPWAFGASDGWTLTDFLENIYLSAYGVKKYQQWYKHQIPWTDSTIKHAFALWAQIVGNTKMIAGGRSTALSQKWDGGAKQMVTDPKAEFFQEATFVGAGLRTDLPNLKEGTDYSAFPFPKVNTSLKATPVEVGPNGIVVFKDTPGTRALTKCLTDPNALAQWAKRGGYISPNNALPLKDYPDAPSKSAAKLLAAAGKANLVVGDASDLMPAAVGAGAGCEWPALQKWFGNPSSTNSILSQLETCAKKAYSH